MAKSFARTRPADKEVLALQTQVGITLDAVVADAAMREDGPWVKLRRSGETGDGPVMAATVYSFDGGASWGAPRYRVNRFGKAEFFGMAKSGSFQTLWTMPVGSRPKKREMFVTFSDGGVTRIDVYDTGEVVLVSGGGGGYFTLTPISYYVGN